MHDIYQSREYNRRTFHSGSTRAWLYGEGFLCENWFELVELYEYSMMHQNGHSGDRLDGMRKWLATLPEDDRAQWYNQRTQRWREAIPEEQRRYQAQVALAARWSRPEAKAHQREQGLVTLNERWRSTVDGFESTAAGVAKHNRALGHDPQARERVGETL